MTAPRRENSTPNAANSASYNKGITSSVGPAGLTTVPYVLINRFDTSNATLPDEFDQAYVYGANGLTASVNQTPNALTANPATPAAKRSSATLLWRSKSQVPI